MNSRIMFRMAMCYAIVVSPILVLAESVRASAPPSAAYSGAVNQDSQSVVDCDDQQVYDARPIPPFAAIGDSPFVQSLDASSSTSGPNTEPDIGAMVAFNRDLARHLTGDPTASGLSYEVVHTDLQLGEIELVASDGTFLVASVTAVHDPGFTDAGPVAMNDEVLVNQWFGVEAQISNPFDPNIVPTPLFAVVSEFTFLNAPPGRNAGQDNATVFFPVAQSTAAASAAGLCMGVLANCGSLDLTPVEGISASVLAGLILAMIIGTGGLLYALLKDSLSCPQLVEMCQDMMDDMRRRCNENCNVMLDCAGNLLQCINCCYSLWKARDCEVNCGEIYHSDPSKWGKDALDSQCVQNATAE